jgi:transcription antitermination factor NusG
MWYVLYTKPRNEKKTAALLTAKNVMVYCPTQISIKQWSDRKKKVEEPLFKSYIFVKLSDYQAECVEVLRTQGAVRFLWHQKKPGIVRDKEIEAIKILLRTYTNVQAIEDSHFLPGDHVRINSGPLQSQEGDLIKIRGQRAFLRLSTLGIELQAEIPIVAIEKIPT